MVGFNNITRVNVVVDTILWKYVNKTRNGLRPPIQNTVVCDVGANEAREMKLKVAHLDGHVSDAQCISQFAQIIGDHTF